MEKIELYENIIYVYVRDVLKKLIAGHAGKLLIIEIYFSLLYMELGQKKTSEKNNDKQAETKFQSSWYTEVEKIANEDMIIIDENA